jgi:hypothetical protein
MCMFDLGKKLRLEDLGDLKVQSRHIGFRKTQGVHARQTLRTTTTHYLYIQLIIEKRSRRCQVSTDAFG